MTTSGMLVGLIALVLALVAGAVATDAFERTAGNSWADADTNGGTPIGVARPLSWSNWAQAHMRPISLSPSPTPSPLPLRPISLSPSPTPSPLPLRQGTGR